MIHKKLIFIILMVAIGGAPFLGISARGQAVNLVKEEMIALDAAFKKIIDAIVLGNMKIIKPALKEVHEAREEVEKAVKAGQKITLQKNQDKLKEFVELDDKFHEEMEVLAKAAEEGNKNLVLKQTHKLLDACVVCHEGFKK
jgi:cytochrome c556